MSKLDTPKPGMIFFSMIAHHSVDLAELNTHFKNWKIHSQASFEYNPSLDYYSKEMGPANELKRWFIFGKNIERLELIEAKIWADSLEKKYSRENKRLVNCDPGIICHEQVLLATGKSYAHRVYLDRGVYAELTYIFEGSAFKSLQWTYPDYQSDLKIELFNLLRSRMTLQQSVESHKNSQK